MDDRGAKRKPGERFEPLTPLELRIAALAASQHGVVALWQLLDFGLSAARCATGSRSACCTAFTRASTPSAIARLTTQGALHGGGARVWPAVGAVASLGGRSPRAVAQQPCASIDVISPRRPGRRRAGIDAHTSSTLLVRDIEDVDGIPCTTVARTLLDLARRRAAPRGRARVRRGRLPRGPRRARDRGRSRSRRQPSRGRRPARDPQGPCGREHADAQRPRGGVPRDLPRAPACRSRRSTPGSRSSPPATRPTSSGARRAHRRDRRRRPTRRGARFEHDRRRDQQLTLAGYRVVRFTWTQVFDEPRSVEATIVGLLRRAA